MVHLSRSNSRVGRRGATYCTPGGWLFGATFGAIERKEGVQDPGRWITGRQCGSLIPRLRTATRQDATARSVREFAKHRIHAAAPRPVEQLQLAFGRGLVGLHDFEQGFEED